MIERIGSNIMARARQCYVADVVDGRMGHVFGLVRLARFVQRRLCGRELGFAVEKVSRSDILLRSGTAPRIPIVKH